MEMFGFLVNGFYGEELYWLDLKDKIKRSEKYKKIIESDKEITVERIESDEYKMLLYIYINKELVDGGELIIYSSDDLSELETEEERKNDRLALEKSIARNFKNYRVHKNVISKVCDVIEEERKKYNGRKGR